MKRKALGLVMFVMACAAMALTSCTKEPEELILGEWTLQKGTATSMGQIYDNTNDLKGLEFDFQEDGVFGIKNAEMSAKGSWSYSNKTLIISYEKISFACHVDNLDKKAMTLSYTEIVDRIEAKQVLEFAKK